MGGEGEGRGGLKGLRRWWWRGGFVFSMAASLFLVDPQETICAGGID